MMLICGQVNRVWHYWAGRHPDSVGVLISPSYMNRVPIDQWMPFALDNDAFTCWRDKKPWNEKLWHDMLAFAAMRGHAPMWVAVPDVVTDRKATLESWKRHKDTVLKRGWKPAFCVQDGMTPEDVPAEASVVFVGGSDTWKLRHLHLWTENFPRVHCARINAVADIETCERMGCESVDGTGWFRDPSRKDKLPAIKRFIEGHRSQQTELSLRT
jgi:hypothetical protein